MQLIDRGKYEEGRIRILVNHQVEKMVEFLMEDHYMTMKDAFARGYSSDVYIKLQNKRSGLYRYSPAYTYQLLNRF